MTNVAQNILQLHPSSHDEDVQAILKKLLHEAIREMGEDACLDNTHQFVSLFKKLSTKKKLEPLEDKNHRLVII